MMIRSAESRAIKKAETQGVPAFLKNWRQPTLAESIKPLPSARLRLTAEFGMGSGRTTALWPPKIVRALKVKRQSVTAQVQHYVKERMPGKRLFSENCTQ